MTATSSAATTGHVLVHATELQWSSTTGSAMAQRTVRSTMRATAVSAGWHDGSPLDLAEHLQRWRSSCRYWQRQHRPVCTPSDIGANHIAHQTATASCPLVWSNVQTATRPVHRREHEKRPVTRMIRVLVNGCSVMSANWLSMSTKRSTSCRLTATDGRLLLER